MKSNVLITGANGQLGKSLQALVKGNNLESFNFMFTTKEQLDITQDFQVMAFFQQNNIDYCINCAAYTAVDKAEEEQEQAFLINTKGVKNLAESCKKYHSTLIHISTDFVFDGTKTVPYTETDTPNPINVYGASKLHGEKHIQELLQNYFIIRTSWLYSKHGQNFVKTMWRLFQEKEVLKVVDDQIGSPTYAGDLAALIYKIIALKSTHYGLYHFSNSGATSWFGFAKEIGALAHSTTDIVPVPSSEFPTKAIRPRYSVLNTTKAQKMFDIQMERWETRLSEVEVE